MPPLPWGLGRHAVQCCAVHRVSKPRLQGQGCKLLLLLHVLQARRRKDEVEREARFHEYVKLQPFTSIDIVDSRFLGNILRRAGPKARDLFNKLPSLASGAALTVLGGHSRCARAASSCCADLSVAFRAGSHSITPAPSITMLGLLNQLLCSACVQSLWPTHTTTTSTLSRQPSRPMRLGTKLQPHT